MMIFAIAASTAQTDLTCDQVKNLYQQTSPDGTTCCTGRVTLGSLTCEPVPALSTLQSVKLDELQQMSQHNIVTDSAAVKSMSKRAALGYIAHVQDSNNWMEITNTLTQNPLLPLPNIMYAKPTSAFFSGVAPYGFNNEAFPVSIVPPENYDADVEKYPVIVVLEDGSYTFAPNGFYWTPTMKAITRREGFYNAFVDSPLEHGAFIVNCPYIGTVTQNRYDISTNNAARYTVQEDDDEMQANLVNYIQYELLPALKKKYPNADTSRDGLIMTGLSYYGAIQWEMGLAHPYLAKRWMPMGTVIARKRNWPSSYWNDWGIGGLAGFPQSYLPDESVTTTRMRFNASYVPEWDAFIKQRTELIRAAGLDLWYYSVTGLENAMRAPIADNCYYQNLDCLSALFVDTIVPLLAQQFATAPSLDMESNVAGSVLSGKKLKMFHSDSLKHAGGHDYYADDLHEALCKLYEIDATTHPDCDHSQVDSQTKYSAAPYTTGLGTAIANVHDLGDGTFEVRGNYQYYNRFRFYSVYSIDGEESSSHDYTVQEDLGFLKKSLSSGSSGYNPNPDDRTQQQYDKVLLSGLTSNPSGKMLRVTFYDTAGIALGSSVIQITTPTSS